LSELLEQQHRSQKYQQDLKLRQRLYSSIRRIRSHPQPQTLSFSPSNSDKDRPTESKFKTQIERLEIDVAEVICKLHSQGIQPSQIAHLLGLPDAIVDQILRELS
jgi:hypothetical protein